jgi:MinD superfamily P-loop ATPase
MKLAVASGKGGTGKTTVAVALALSADGPVQLLDCDVEEPNAHLFLRPTIQSEVPVIAPVPELDESRCTGCGECASFCQFHAIACVKGRAMIFEELCHHCGGCAKVCPQGAITDHDRTIGRVRKGAAGDVSFAQGALEVGAPTAPPVVRAVKKNAEDDRLVVLDCPPGAACPMVAAVSGADFVLLVTEPTPFGLHDLQAAARVVEELGLPFAVIVNRSGIGDGRVRDWCEERGVRILAQIPESRAVAEAIARGTPLTEAAPEWRETFRCMPGVIRSMMGGDG